MSLLPEMPTPRSIKSMTLIELIVSVVIVGIIILSFYVINTASWSRVVNLERRSKIQSEFSYALDHMSKYTQQAFGSVSRPGIQIFPVGNPTGFRVWVDFNQTPSDSSDDAQVVYSLDGNNLEVTCTGVGAGCPPSFNERLSSKVCANVIKDVTLPGSLPASPAYGLYLVETGGSSIEIGLAGQFFPNQPRSDRNPQVGIKTELICNSCSTN